MRTPLYLVRHMDYEHLRGTVAPQLALAALALLAICAKPASTQTYYCAPWNTYSKAGAAAPCPVQWQPVGQPPGETAAHSQGVSDGRELRAWSEAQTGERRAGSEWWAANRSLRDHASCPRAAHGGNQEFIAGCEEAKRRLDPIDDRRHRDAEYRAGFNAGWKEAPAAAAPAYNIAPAAKTVLADDVQNATRSVAAMLRKDGGGLASNQSSCPSKDISNRINNGWEFVVRSQVSVIDEVSNAVLIDSGMCNGGNGNGQYLIIVEQVSPRIITNAEISDMSFFGGIYESRRNICVPKGILVGAGRWALLPLKRSYT